MSVGTLSGQLLADKTIQDGNHAQTVWVRPTDWLTLPTLTPTDQKFVGLHAIHENANFIALSASGAYTVNWGDGTVQNFAAGAVAQYEYNYATYDVANATLCSRGYKQAIITVTPQAGNNLTALNLHLRHTTFPYSSISGLLDIAVAGPYLTDLRIGAVTPDSITQNIYTTNLESVNIVSSDLRQCGNLFNACHRLANVTALNTTSTSAKTVNVTFTSTGKLVTSAGHGLRNGDTVTFSLITTTTGITVNTRYYVISATTDTFQIATTYAGVASTLTNNGSGVARIGTTMMLMFMNCFSLVNVPAFNTSQVLDMSFLFSGCRELKNVPLLDTSKVYNMANMFQNCHMLANVPVFNTVSVIDMTNMFYFCYNLNKIPFFNTVNVVKMATMFAGAYSLNTIPLLDTSKVTDMSNMFSSCYGLINVPLLDTSKVLNMSGMFAACTNLTTVSIPNATSATDMGSMFSGCTKLRSIPQFVTGAVTNLYNTFFNCWCLTTVPLFNSSLVVDMTGLFQNCWSLNAVPALDASSVTAMNSMFQNCVNLSKMSMVNIKITFSVATCKLSPAALNEIYTNLPTVSAKTITVTNNYGVATDNPAIATAKGWTVTG